VASGPVPPRQVVGARVALGVARQVWGLRRVGRRRATWKGEEDLDKYLAAYKKAIEA
jgi:hypothetical protein